VLRPQRGDSRAPRPFPCKSDVLSGVAVGPTGSVCDPPGLLAVDLRRGLVGPPLESQPWVLERRISLSCDPKRAIWPGSQSFPCKLATSQGSQWGRWGPFATPRLGRGDLRRVLVGPLGSPSRALEKGESARVATPKARSATFTSFSLQIGNFSRVAVGSVGVRLRPPGLGRL
jgi:hypothetical protein